MGDLRVRSEQRIKNWLDALVVVADDGLRAIVVELLTQEHFVAFDVRTFAEARDVLRLRKPTLVIVDPDVHARDELRAFLATLDLELSSVVLLSDRASVADVARELDVPWVREPFELDDLVTQIVRVASSSRGAKSAAK